MGIIFNVTLLTLLGYFLGGPFLAQGLTYSFMFVWTRKNPLVPMSYWGFQILAWYLPFVLIGVSLLLGGAIKLHILGILAGHGYIYLDALDLIHCPDGLLRLCNAQSNTQVNWRGSTGHRLG